MRAAAESDEARVRGVGVDRVRRVLRPLPLHAARAGRTERVVALRAVRRRWCVSIGHLITQHREYVASVSPVACCMRPLVCRMLRVATCILHLAWILHVACRMLQVVCCKSCATCHMLRVGWCMKARMAPMVDGASITHGCGGPVVAASCADAAPLMRCDAHASLPHTCSYWWYSRVLTGTHGHSRVRRHHCVVPARSVHAVS